MIEKRMIYFFVREKENNGQRKLNEKSNKNSYVHMGETIKKGDKDGRKR